MRREDRASIVGCFLTRSTSRRGGETWKEERWIWIEGSYQAEEFMSIEGKDPSEENPGWSLFPCAGWKGWKGEEVETEGWVRIEEVASIAE